VQFHRQECILGKAEIDIFCSSFSGRLYLRKRLSMQLNQKNVKLCICSTQKSTICVRTAHKVTSKMIGNSRKCFYLHNLRIWSAWDYLSSAQRMPREIQRDLAFAPCTPRPEYRRFYDTLSWQHPKLVQKFAPEALNPFAT
jgi:hypothetical protein